MEKNEIDTVRDSAITSIKSSLGSAAPANKIYNPESQLLNEMIKDNSTFNRKQSSVSINSFMGEDFTDFEHDINEDIYNYPFIQKMDELSTELNKEFALESEEDEDNEDQKAIINDLLNFKTNINSKVNESSRSEVDTQSSLFTDNETQSDYSMASSTKFNTEPLKSRIWYYKKSPELNSRDHPDDDLHSFSDDDDDDSSMVDDSTAAIRQLKLHHYVSTNNLKVNKKDNGAIVKRRTTIAYSKFRPRINPTKNFDYTHDINDIPLFSNKEFKTEAKANYYIADTSIDDYNTSKLLNMTGDASRKRRSQIASQRNRTLSQALINENTSTITPPLSPNSFKKFSSNANTNTFSNVNNKKQPQLNNPMNHSTRLILKSENIYSSSDADTTSPTTTTEANVTANINNPSSAAINNNTNQLYKVLLMAKDQLFSLGGKFKRSDSIKSYSSRRSSIRKHTKKSKRRQSIRSRKHSLLNDRKDSITQNISLQDLSEDEMTNISSITNETDTHHQTSTTLHKKTSNPSQLKTVHRKSSNLTHSRNSSLVSGSTRRSSLYNKSKIYQNDFSINYSVSNLSDSTGLDLDDNKKYEESFDLDLQNNSKNDKPRVYGVCPDSYNSQYHEPIASSVDGRSSIFEDYDDEESFVTESEAGVISSYTNNGETFEIDDIRNKLNMQPITTSSLTSESPTISTIKNIKLTNVLGKNKKSLNEKVSNDEKIKKNEKIGEDEQIKEKEMPKDDNKSLKKQPSSSTLATNHSTDSLTPTITTGNVDGSENATGKEQEKQDNIDDHSTITGSVYGDTKSVTASNTTLAASRFGGNYDGFFLRGGGKRQWDDESSSTYSHSRFNDNEYKHSIEMASMPEGIRESVNYPTIKQIPLPYYRYGVYMYITDPVIVQTRTMMERMFSAHTIYTITVKLLRPNLPMYRNDSICTFTVHKRYRQFRSFYKEIHKKYKDTINDWPEFPKKTYFDRFDSDTIKKRAFAFSSLMSFISLHPLLYNCPVLLTFLELTGTMHNPLSTVGANISQRQRQRQHPDGSVIIEKSSLPIEGKTIQFEGRNVAPSIPKIFGSLGRRQYPPGYYGQLQFPPSYFDTNSNSSSAASPTTNANAMMQLNRRSMYDTPYYNQDYYSSFGRPQLSKMRTTEFLKNRNSMYSNLSANEIERNKTGTGSERDPEASSSKSQTTPKLSSVEVQKNNGTTTVKPPLAKATSTSKASTTINPPYYTKFQKSISSTKLDQRGISPSSSNTSTPKLTSVSTSTDPKTTNTSIIPKNTETTPQNSSSSTSSTSAPQNKSTVIPNPLMDAQTVSPENIDHTTVQPSIDKASNTKGKSTSPSSVSTNTTTSTSTSSHPPVIPRTRPRSRTTRNYPAVDELDCRPLSRYNHYQQINEIPGFQYLISEFPKLRSHQNKRYSSIF